MIDLPDKVKMLIDVNKSNQSLYIQRNNRPTLLSLSDRIKRKGAIFTDLFTAAREHSDLLQKYFMKDAVKVDEHNLTALHAAFLNGGVFLYVPKNVEVKEPIQAVFLHDDEETTLFNHVFVVLKIIVPLRMLKIIFQQ